MHVMSAPPWIAMHARIRAKCALGSQMLSTLRVSLSALT